MRQEIAREVEQRGNQAVTDEETEKILRSSGVAAFASDRQSASALEAVVEEILAAINSFLLDLPHTLGSEIIDNGIWLTGGGALIPGIRERLEERTGINVKTVDNPLFAVIEGARDILPVVAALNQWR